MTTPTGPIVASASVAITPSTATFNPQLQAALQRAMNAVSNAADDMGDSIARGITSGVVRARLALNTLTDGLNDRLRVTVSVIGNAERGILSVGQTALQAGAAFGAMGLAAGGAASALGALLAVASQLSGIMVALPAVIGSAALVMGTLKLATQGFGEALSASLTGDMEEIFAAFSKLSPAARTAAQAVFQLRGRIDVLKKAVQENFFQPMAVQFGQFARQATGVAEQGLPRISSELGKIAGEFLKVANSGSFFPGLRTLIDQTVSGLQRWQGVSGAVANALGDLFRVGAQFSGDLIAGIGQLVQRTAEWISTAAATGELERRLQTALDAFAQLGRIIQQVGQIFGAFWFAGQEAGVGLLDTIESIVTAMATFANSDAGIAAITQVMTLASTAGGILADVLGGLLPIVGDVAVVMASSLTGALQTLAPAIDQIIIGLGDFVTNVIGPIQTGIAGLSTSFAGLGGPIGGILGPLGDLVGLFVEHFVGILQVIIPLVGSFITALTPMMPVIREILSAVSGAFLGFLQELVNAITPLIPLLVTLAVDALRVVADLFVAVFDAVKPFLPVLVELAGKVLTLLVDRFTSLIGAIEPLIPVIIDVMSKGFEILAQVLPIVADALTPLLPLIIDIARQVGTALAPVLPALVDSFKEILRVLVPLLPQLAELAGDILVTAAQLFTALVTAIAPILPPLIQIGTEILQTLVPAFLSLIQALMPILPVLSDLAVRVLKEGLLPILQAILPVIPMLTDAMIQLLPSFVDLIPPLVDITLALAPIIVLLANIATTILQVVIPPVVLIMTILNEFRAITLTLLGAAIEALVLIFKISWDHIVAVVQIAWAVLKGVFDTIISLLQGDFSEAWRRLQRMVGEVWDIIKGFVSGAVNDIIGYLGEWGPKIYNAVWDALTAVAGVFSDKFAEFVTTVRDKINEMLGWVREIGPNIGLIFLDAGKWLYDSGKNIIQGFINGIADKAQDLYGKLQEIVNKAKELWDGATGWLIGSPSKWMAQRGQWVVQGFADGLESEQSVAVNAIQDLINATQNPVESSLTDSTPDLSGILGRVSSTPLSTTSGSSGNGLSVAFGQGSVVISFEGVVPSEADALRTGYAVGNGILDVLARRDARLAVRVM